MKYKDQFEQAFADLFGAPKNLRPSEARALFVELGMNSQVIPTDRNYYSYKELLNVYLNLKR